MRKKGAARDHVFERNYTETLLPHLIESFGQAPPRTRWASDNTCPRSFRERTCRLMRFDLIAVQGGVDPRLGRSPSDDVGCDLGVGCAFGRG